MMKHYRLVLSLTLLSALSARAGVVVTDSLQSAVLGAQVKYNVYLPDSFGQGDRHYPVVYLLHGLSDDYQSWMQKGSMQVVVDELIGTGEVCEMVVVMPNAGGPDIHHTWNGYFNMPGWRYEDFFFGELMPAVEAKYRAGGCKDQRAIMGLSMGGGGSTVYCQRHPELFSSCYAMSPWLDNARVVVNDPSDPYYIDSDNPSDKLAAVCKSVLDNSAIRFVERADEAALDKLRSVKWFIDCGDDDFLLDLNLAFYQKMRNRGVKSELRVRNGVHSWEYWHLALRWALPFASRNFGK